MRFRIKEAVLSSNSDVSKQRVNKLFWQKWGEVTDELREITTFSTKLVLRDAPKVMELSLTPAEPRFAKIQLSAFLQEQ